MKLHLSGKRVFAADGAHFKKMFLIALLAMLMCSGLPPIVHGYPEIVKEHILNYLDYHLEGGLEGGLLAFMFVLDSYDLLEVEIPNRTQVIELLDSLQSSEGTWLTGENHYVPITAQVLMFYNRSGVKPARSLEPFFSTVDTWEKVNAHVNTYNSHNYWGGLWGYVNAYIVYKGESPPWTDEFLAEVNEQFDTWAYDNHQRTHLIPNLLQLHRPIPRLDEVIGIILQQQNQDGSWDYNVVETAISIQVLKNVRNQTTVDGESIDSAISSGLSFIQDSYKTIEYEGKTYGGFAMNPSEQYPTQVATAEGIWLLLNPDSNIWSRWHVTHALFTFEISWYGNHTIALVSNLTISNFSFNSSLKQISFSATCWPTTTGHCNISIPKTFMWCDNPSQWKVTVSNSSIEDLLVKENSTHTFLYFVYRDSRSEVSIKATNVISEFPTSDTTPPTISVLSPENKTFLVSDVSLTFTVSESTSWIGYSLNGQNNITIIGNTTLLALSDGTYTITVYANDTAGNMGSSDTIYFTIQTLPIDTTPPNISVTSPENKTYAITEVPLTFTVDESVSWVAYSLDNEANITIAGNTTLSGLPDGPHSIIVYAKDTAGNTGASEIIHFSIETPEPAPFPTWIVAVIVIVVIFGAALLVFFKRK